jgi:hypothetical protein
MQWKVLEDARQDVSGRYEIKVGASELSHCHFTKLQNSTKSGSAFFFYQNKLKISKDYHI